MNPGSRYPSWMRRALYRSAVERNVVEPQGVYTRPAVRPAPFYTPYGVQFVFDLPYSAYTVARVGDDPGTAKGFIENMVELAVTEGPDVGMLPRSVTFAGDQAGQDGSQPSILAWAAWTLHTIEPDEGFLSRAYPGLAASTDWWQSDRRDVDGDGLSEAAGSTPVYASFETGHDHSPERDLVLGEPGPAGPDGLVHEPIADVFLNSCIYADLDALRQIAEVVDPGRSEEWRERRDRLGERMRDAMWDEEVGGFFPVIRRDLCPSQPRVHRHTPALLMPLWAGVATPEQAARTVDTVQGISRDYPTYDGAMTIRLDPSLYRGYQVVTHGLHPTAGPGAAAGGVELGFDGLIARFAADRGPAAAAFSRLSIEVAADAIGDFADLSVTVLDGDGRRHEALQGRPAPDEPLRGLVQEGRLGIHQDTWMRGLREIELRARDCRPRELTVRYWQVDRSTLLSRYGLKSAHPLDGKHPAPDAPTEFWSGTVWGPHNFHACHALQRYGYHDLARSIATGYCDGVVAAFLQSGSAMEHHHSETGRGLGTRDYSWGAAVALSLMADFLDPLEAADA